MKFRIGDYVALRGGGIGRPVTIGRVVHIRPEGRRMVHVVWDLPCHRRRGRPYTSSHIPSMLRHADIVTALGRLSDA